MIIKDGNTIRLGFILAITALFVGFFSCDRVHQVIAPRTPQIVHPNVNGSPRPRLGRGPERC